MLVTKEYNRDHACEYARKWALDRNSLFAEYDGLGGDCTNFTSQAILAGGCTMNYIPTFGWYYINSSERTASWTGVQYFYNFITSNVDVGPFGHDVTEGGLDIGDIIQLGRRDGTYYHTLIVTGFAKNTYLVSAHSDNALDRPLNTYKYYRARFIRIDGVKIDISEKDGCFLPLLNGKSLNF